MGNLNIILGRPGSGKTKTVVDSIKKSRRSLQSNPENEFKRIFVIVPEQFSHETERKLIMERVDNENVDGLMFTEVLSFSRLAYRLFTELGHSSDTVLDDISKSMLIRHIIIQKQDELGYFKNNAMINGYILEIKRMISEFMNYGVSPDDVEKIIEECKNEEKPKITLINRLKDVNVIYTAFDEYLRKNKLHTSDGKLQLVCDILENYESVPILEGADIYIDGFSDFMYYQTELIRNLIRLCDNVFVTIFYDKKQKNGLFNMSKNTLDTVLNCVDVNGNSDIKYKFLNEQFRSESEELKWLEGNIFRRGYQKYSEPLNDISVYEFLSSEKEADFAVTYIRNLMIKKMNEGIRYKDIAIVTGDIKTYGPIIREAFSKTSIPVFIDDKVRITDNSFLYFVKNILDVVLKDFERESVLRVLRSGFLWECNAEFLEEVDLLDNFLLATGIRGSKLWKEEWECENAIYDARFRKRRGSKGKDDEKKSDVDVKINKVRSDFYEKIIELFSKLSGDKKTVKAYSDALCEFFTSNYIDEKLEEIYLKFERIGDFQKAGEFRQVYNIFMKVLDTMKDVLVDEVMDLDEFSKILSSGLDGASIGTIPNEDSVTVGDVFRSRINDVKYLIFLGARDSLVPGTRKSGGLINDDERKFISELKIGDREIHLSPGANEQIKMDEFRLYVNISKASEKFIVTYPITSEDEKGEKPAYFINRLRNIFTELEVKRFGENNEDELEKVLGADFGLNSAIEGIRNDREGNSYLNDFKERIIEQFIAEDLLIKLKNNGIFAESVDELSPEIVQELYSYEDENGNIKVENFSISQLEKFAACPYEYFLQYGLKLRERAVHEVSPIVVGNVIHDAFDKLVQNMKSERLDWKDFADNKEEFNQIASKSFEEIKNDFNDNGVFNSKRGEFILHNFRETYLKNANVVLDQMLCGNYSTLKSEMEYHMSEPVEIHGLIDRVDICEGEYEIEENGEVKKVPCEYVKVIDYKTGNKNVSLQDLYYGLQLQMVVYMGAAEKNENDRMARERESDKRLVIPAGIFYVNIKDEISDVEKAVDYRNNGIYDGNPYSVQALDNSLVGYKSEESSEIKYIEGAKSEIINFQTTKTGAVASTTKDYIYDKNEMHEIIGYGKTMIKKLSDKRNAGEIGIKPFRVKKDNNEEAKNACTYCKFNSICGFDKMRDRYKDLKEMKNREALERIVADK